MELFRYRKDIPIESSLYLLALTVFTIRGILASSCLSEIIPATILKLMYDAVLVLLLLKWIAGERFTLVKLLVWIVTLGMSGWLAYSFGYTDIFVMIVLFMSADGSDLSDIMRTLLLTTLIWTLLVVALSLAGVLEDYVYPHSASFFTTQAHSMGFRYYSTLGYRTMMCTMYYLYLERNFSWVRVGVLTAVNFALYLVHTTGLALLIALLFLAAYVLIYRYHRLQLKARGWNWASIILPWFLFAVTEFLVLQYMRGNITADSRFLSTLISRLKYSSIAIERFGLHMFGTEVVTYGNTAMYHGVSTTSFFIDSGFVYSMVAYGLVFTGMLLIMYSLLCSYVWRRADRFVYVVMVIMLCTCVLQDFLLNPVYNPGLFTFPCLFYYRTERKKRTRSKPVKPVNEQMLE